MNYPILLLLIFFPSVTFAQESNILSLAVPTLKTETISPKQDKKNILGIKPKKNSITTADSTDSKSSDADDDDD